jgi:MATE family, multidrug efflux pump
LGFFFLGSTMKKLKINLTQDPIGSVLARMTAPMLVGVFSMVAFNLADTFFVAQLGTRELAAMSFTFPVVMFVHSITMGLGMATSSVVSRAIGEGNQDRVRRLASDCFILAFLIVVVMATVGILTIEPLFRLLGATPDLIPLIKSYMSIWYLGIIVIIIPNIGNNVIRATGDTVYPSMIMTIAAIINIVLDPLLIFGLAGFPRMELAGAALTTVISRSIVMVVALAILHFRERIIDYSLPRFRHLMRSWKNILYVAVPAGATNILLPLSMGFVTWMAARFGHETVAAVGAAIRVEQFSLMVLIALGISLMPVVGQNWGAKNFDRVRQAQHYAFWFAFAWGFFAWMILAAFAHPVARLFSTESAVIDNIVLYLRITPIGYGLYGVMRLASVSFNAINRPLSGALLSLIRTFVFFIPAVYVGATLLGPKGIFGGIAIANILSGLTAIIWVYHTRTLEDKEFGGDGELSHPPADGSLGV